MNCPHCQKNIPENLPGLFCPFCQRELRPPEISKLATTLPPANKTRCWVVFWIGFLGGPALALLGLRSNNPVLLALAPVGTLAAAFALARRFGKTPSKRALLTVLFTLGLIVVHFAIFFVGCLSALSKI